MGHLYNLAHFLDRGLVKPPLLVQGVFGILGGLAAEPTHLVHFSERPRACSGATTCSWPWRRRGVTRCR